ncbi:Imm51 family immunity protein [Paenibacillus sp. FSL R7-0273]|uniref:Imm51 family immunity protein n=1 Tax=Paenibacillus sp. FSL R7-0273 TaxID=1536772 RepID=UPI0007C7D5F5|nr:Imm51 family immunity protein [Paenibacillus sp. FSL R7-0273]OMF90865.1 glucan biosynthesis protein [Paenibacillus sp. FSL R7-0273]
MNMNLTSQFAQWHENDEHQRIVDVILEIPASERDYGMISSLGRAFNNLGLYEEGLEQFHLIAAEGEKDPLWHFRTGYSYYYLDRHEEAVQAFRAALALDPGDEQSALLLDWSRRKLEQERIIAANREQSRTQKRTGVPFEGMDLEAFWDDSDYALESYVSDPPDDELIASVEQELGYKLPASYITLMKQHNGGVPHNTCFPTNVPTSWADDHAAITGIMGIGRDKSYSLCGDLGSPFMIEEWGYPDIGVVICDCPSAGHDVIMLDYRHCGKDGEPEVIHVDQEADYEITYLAPDFETFIRGLVHEELYDTSAEDREEDLRKVQEGEFSPLLAELCSRMPRAEQLAEQIRAVCLRVVSEKGYFSFHADELSLLMYDVQFALYTNAYPQPSREEYLEAYPKMIAFGGAFGQGGYAPGFITDWLDRRIKEGQIVKSHGKLAFTAEAASRVLQQLEAAASLAEDEPEGSVKVTEAGEEAVAAGTGAGAAEVGTEIGAESAKLGAKTEAETAKPVVTEAEVAPFKLVEQANGGMSVILVVGSYRQEVFAARADEGFEGNGYDWASLAAVFLGERMPELREHIHFDPEADMFCAYSSDRAALQAFILGFKQACEQEQLIHELFSRAELD